MARRARAATTRHDDPLPRGPSDAASEGPPTLWSRPGQALWSRPGLSPVHPTSLAFGSLRGLTGRPCGPGPG